MNQTTFVTQTRQKQHGSLSISHFFLFDGGKMSSIIWNVLIIDNYNKYILYMPSNCNGAKIQCGK